MFKNTMTGILSAAVLFGASTAVAATELKTMSVADLPDEGRVELKGTVASMIDDQSFKLRDRTGGTVTIDAKLKLDVEQGDTVRVVGMIDTSALGITKEVDATSVTVIDSIGTETDADTETKAETDPR
jgi:uncharacterized protein YdeI (BOF family)